jgi:hypothetical protein
VPVVVPGEQGYLVRELPRAELVGTVLTAPVVEELYLHRYLLPRMFSLFARACLPRRPAA